MQSHLACAVADLQGVGEYQEQSSQALSQAKVWGRRKLPSVPVQSKNRGHVRWHGPPEWASSSERRITVGVITSCITKGCAATCFDEAAVASAKVRSRQSLWRPPSAARCARAYRWPCDMRSADRPNAGGWPMQQAHAEPGRTPRQPSGRYPRRHRPRTRNARRKPGRPFNGSSALAFGGHAPEQRVATCPRNEAEDATVIEEASP